MTEYIILRLEELPDGVAEPGVWKEYGGATASSPTRALHSFGDTIRDGTYVAMPRRSWKPLTVALKKTTKVTIG